MSSSKKSLFFTQAAVDAFAELDLYIIRPATNDEQHCHENIVAFYKDNQKLFDDIEVCVDMSRKWVINKILPAISTRMGIYDDPNYTTKKLFDYQQISKVSEVFESYKTSLSEIEEFKDRNKEGHIINPTTLYNNIYALLIMLWAFGDWDDSGTQTDINQKARIERALVQLISNYRNIPILQKVLTNIPYNFYLPGGSYFKEGLQDNEKPEYTDSGFITLLARQLVLFGVYGIGDRNIIDPLIRNMYIDLMLNRYRVESAYAYLWSQNQKEIFSTYRAIQTLTFYHAYLRGYEKSRSQSINETTQVYDYRDFFEGLLTSISTDIDKVSIVNSNKRSSDSEESFSLSFREYILQNHSIFPGGTTNEQTSFFTLIEKKGNELINYYNQGGISTAIFRELLQELTALINDPFDEESNLKKTAYKSFSSKYNKAIRKD